MAHERILSNVERDFMRSALDLGLRIDGRKMGTIRETKIEFGGKTGTVEVALGKTRVLARAIHELTTPRRDKRNEGAININCTFPKYLQESISNDEVDRICLLIKAGIYESKAIDLESLCILNGEKVWTIEVDLTVIQHDGNIIDCANLATLCALKHHRRPDVTVVGSTITVHSMLDRHPVALSIHHLPICVTLGHVKVPADAKPMKKVKHGFYTFLDPTAQEEQLMEGKTVYCMTRHHQLCAVDKIGGVAMAAQSFLQFIDQFIMDVVKRWSNEIENKFIQYSYQLGDKQRKEKLKAKVVNPIDVFNFGDLREKTEDTEKEARTEKDDADDVLMMDEQKGGMGDQIWTEWEKEEQLKLTQIRDSLRHKHSEKRMSANKSVLTSEFH